MRNNGIYCGDWVYVPSRELRGRVFASDVETVPLEKQGAILISLVWPKPALKNEEWFSCKAKEAVKIDWPEGYEIERAIEAWKIKLA